MRWVYWNPVLVRFGAGAFDEVAGLIRKRRYALVTYDQPIFKDLAARLAEGSAQTQSAGAEMPDAASA